MCLWPWGSDSIKLTKHSRPTKTVCWSSWWGGGGHLLCVIQCNVAWCERERGLVIISDSYNNYTQQVLLFVCVCVCFGYWKRRSVPCSNAVSMAELFRPSWPMLLSVNLERSCRPVHLHQGQAVFGLTTEPTVCCTTVQIFPHGS